MQRSDNSAAESGSNKLWSTTEPLATFLEQLCLASVSLGIEIDVSHIPCKNNEAADELSRWNQNGSPPQQFNLEDRIRIPLKSFWLVQTTPSLRPPQTLVPWKLPT